ncbi:MAG: Ig domain-containing protein, partial [Lachnospiraceae bacterium]|nr:Ig domain-containing protein [Lachnospiraceae bacterium]
MKIKKRVRRLLSLWLSLVMIISNLAGLVPGMSLTALAWDGDPYAALLNTTTAVNFDGKEWYLIENNSTATNAGTVTLLAKECVAASQYNSSGSYVEYASSTVKTAVDNWYNNHITSNAKTAVVDNKMFLLTKDQADAMTEDTRKCSKYNGEDKWWLCSPGDSDYVAGVNGYYGEVISDFNAGSVYCVRPALKLDLSKVTFDSTSNTFTVVNSSVAVTGVTLDKTTAQTIDVDNKVTFTATVSPDNASDKTVKWSVGGTNADAVTLYSDENCTTEVGTDATSTLTVYAKGISAGSATITATSNADSTKSASCDVTVNEAQTQTEELLTTITATGKEQASYNPENV